MKNRYLSSIMTKYYFIYIDVTRIYLKVKISMAVDYISCKTGIFYPSLQNPISFTLMQLDFFCSTAT